MQVEVVSPERILFSGEAEMVDLPRRRAATSRSSTNHAPFLGALDIGVVKVILPRRRATSAPRCTAASSRCATTA